MGLRVYTVHLPPSSEEDWTPALVKEGFSWPGFFFGVVWALWHRLWIESAALLALFIAAGVVFDAVDLGDSIESLITFAIALLIGFNGNDWRRQSLRRRGYQESGVVAGPEADSALRRFLDLRAVTAGPRLAYPAAATVVPAPSPASGMTGAPVTGSIAGWYSSTVQPASQADRGYPPDYPPGSKAGV